MVTGLLLLVTLVVAVPKLLGKELVLKRDGRVDVEEHERRPLLDDE